jgi:triosephosphate isomerase
MSKRKPLVAGNWKMNGSLAANASLIRDIAAAAPGLTSVELLVCPPFVYLPSVASALKGSAIELGAQNLSEQDKPGAYTGEVLGAMLVEVDCRYVVVGHSERRSYYHETNELVARKTRAAIAAGLRPIVCVGETLAERESGRTEAVLKAQIGAVLDSGDVASLKDFVIAYEPVWAIGTGRTATPEQAQEAHALLRGEVAARDAKLADSVRILYGGSVKSDNAAVLFAGADVDGGLIGGASLKAAEFLAIAAAAKA